METCMTTAGWSQSRAGTFGSLPWAGAAATEPGPDSRVPVQHPLPRAQVTAVTAQFTRSDPKPNPDPQGGELGINTRVISTEPH